MKQFLRKLLIFGTMALVSHIIAGYHMNGNTDTNYLRFTPQDNSGIIMGTSRAAQAICPEDILFHPGMFNAGFSMYTSPYGEVYFDYIKKQLNKEDRDQMFIFCVDPWALSSPIDSQTGVEILGEKNKMVGTTQTIGYPNWEFIIDQYSYGWGNIIKEHYRPTTGMYLHQDGWLEVNRPFDAHRSDQRRANKIRGYQKEVFVTHHPSNYRKLYLRQMIRGVKGLGKVLLVRIPVHPEFFELEETFWPSFEREMEQLAIEEAVTFWSPKELNDQLPFNDGHHMNREGSHRFSQLLNRELSRLN
jgi:hypothetical protein